MKSLILVIEGVAPEVLLSDDRLVNLRALWDEGISGPLDHQEASGGASTWQTLMTCLLHGAVGSGLDESAPTLIRLGHRGGTGPEAIPVHSGLPLIDRAVARTVAASDQAHGLERIGPDIVETVTGIGDGPLPDRVMERIRTRFHTLRAAMAGHTWDVALIVDTYPAESIAPGTIAGCSAWSSAFDEEVGRTIDSVIERESEVTVLVIVPGSSDEISMERDDGSRRKGAFALNSSRGLPTGEIDGVRLVDLAPTILALDGREVPEGSAGRPLSFDQIISRSPDDELEAVRDRLRGLGYLA